MTFILVWQGAFSLFADIKEICKYLFVKMGSWNCHLREYLVWLLLPAHDSDVMPMLCRIASASRRFLSSSESSWGWAASFFCCSACQKGERERGSSAWRNVESLTDKSAHVSAMLVLIRCWCGDGACDDLFLLAVLLFPLLLLSDLGQPLLLPLQLGLQLTLVRHGAELKTHKKNAGLKNTPTSPL